MRRRVIFWKDFETRGHLDTRPSLRPGQSHCIAEARSHGHVEGKGKTRALTTMSVPIGAGEVDGSARGAHEQESYFMEMAAHRLGPWPYRQPGSRQVVCCEVV